MQEEEKELMQKSEKIKTKLAAAKIKSQKALAAVEAAIPRASISDLV